jgi:hypothetical protein
MAAGLLKLISKNDTWVVEADDGRRWEAKDGRWEVKTIKLHPSITVDRVADAVERHLTSLDSPGFCVACGDNAEGVKPDARKYKCQARGKKAVYTTDKLPLMMVP